MRYDSLLRTTTRNEELGFGIDDEERNAKPDRAGQWVDRTLTNIQRV